MNNCCTSPSIANFDHSLPDGFDYHNLIQITNQVCTRCYAHWYGRNGNVKNTLSKNGITGLIQRLMRRRHEA